MTALQWAPTVQPEGAGYAPRAALTEAWRAGAFARSWWMGGQVVSGQRPGAVGAGIWKCQERLSLTDPAAQLDALAAVGVPHPASYSDVFHSVHARRVGRPVPLRATVNRLFEGWAGGPWSEAMRPGRHGGTWHRYDLCQAYRWAATCGLPDPATYTVRDCWHPDPGLWWADLRAIPPGLPPALTRPGPVVVSTEDLATYQLRATIRRGVTWTRTLPADHVERTLAAVPCPRECGRAYWGRWIAREPLVVRTAAREWSLKRNPWQHFVWGWLVIARVRARVWAASGSAAHVYVDEVVVPHELPTGERIGDWRLKETYRRGLTVHRTGHYGPADRLAPTMQTGVAHHAA